MPARVTRRSGGRSEVLIPFPRPRFSQRRRLLFPIVGTINPVIQMSATTIHNSLCAAGLLAALFIAGMSGCETGPLAKQNWKNPFGQTETSYKEAYGLTPAQVSRQIRNLGDDAAEMTESQQKSACGALIDRYSKESDPLIRRDMVYALGSFPDVYSLPGLRAAIEDSDPFVRIEACRAWSHRSSAEALEALAGIAQADDNVDVRQAAVTGLRRFQSPAAIRVLGTLLNDRDPALQYLTIQSLKGATGQDLGDDVRKWNAYIASNYGDTSPSSAPEPGQVDRSGSMVAETPSTDSWR